MQPANPKAILREQVVNGDTAIYVGPAVLIKSKSQPTGWHIVSDGTCDCPGYTYYGRCRHLDVAAIVVELDRPKSCSDCGQRWPMVDGACTAVKGAR